LVAVPAVGTLAREVILRVATHGFIGCYGDIHATYMESLCWRYETGRHASRDPRL